MPLASARQRPEKLFVGRAGNFLPAAPLERRTENASRQLDNRERSRLFSIALSGLGSLPWASWLSRSSTGTDTKGTPSLCLALAAGRVFVFLLVLAGACQIGTTYDASGFVTEPIHAFVQLLLQGNGAGGAGPGWSSRSEEGNNEGRETKGIRKRARVRRSELDSAAKEPQTRRRQPEATRKGNEEERTTRSHEYNKQ